MRRIIFGEQGSNLLETEEQDDIDRPEKPVRRLNATDGFSILVGIIIGSGIFSSPGLALDRSGSPGLSLLAWAASGILVLLASQCYIELGCMMPTAGGDFDYLMKAYGERAAFSFAWYTFWISKPGSQAIIATIFGRYFQAVVTGNTNGVENGESATEFSIAKISAALLIIAVTILNINGVKESTTLQFVLICTKFLLIGIIFISAIAFASSNQGPFLNNLSIASSFDGSNSLVGFGSSMVACLWGFDGWADLNFMQEELTNPTKQLPLVAIGGVAAVTVCYLVANIAYFCVLSHNTIVDSNAIAVEFGTTVLNKGFALFIAFGVCLSTTGSVNGSIMTGGRAFYAVARSGKAPAVLAKLNSVGAPWAALVAQGVWGVVLLLLPGSSFSTLLDYFGPMSWLYYAFCASALITLRIREPDLPRPYKIPWYPLPPVLVIVVAFVIFISAWMEDPLFITLAAFFVALSFPVHLCMEWYNYYYKKDHKKLSSSDNEEDELEEVNIND